MFNNTNTQGFYQVGGLYHNDNGEDYTIIAYDAVKDRILLCRTTESDTPFYVGAWAVRPHSWGQGHYFMENLKEAVDWFYGK